MQLLKSFKDCTNKQINGNDLIAGLYTNIYLISTGKSNKIKVLERKKTIKKLENDCPM